MADLIHRPQAVLVFVAVSVGTWVSRVYEVDEQEPIRWHENVFICPIGRHWSWQYPTFDSWNWHPSTN